MSVRSSAQQNGEGLLEWLLDVDETGGLDQYRRTISQLYSSPSQVISAYTVNGGSRPVFDTQFFDDMGVVDVRHRRLFQRWFEEQRSRGAAPRKTVSRGPSAKVSSGEAPEARERVAKRGGGDVEVRGSERGARANVHSKDCSRAGLSAAVRSRSGRLPWEDDALGDRTSESGQESESGRSWGSRSWWDSSGGWGGSGSWRGKDGWTRGSGGQWWGGEKAGCRDGPSGDRTLSSSTLAGGSDGGILDHPPATGGVQGSVHAVVGKEVMKDKPSSRSSKAQELDSKRTPAGPLDKWLLDLDRSGALLRYRSPLADFFDDPQQIFRAYTTPYTTPGITELVLSFDHNFFLEAEVMDASHRVVFERWFTMQIEASCRDGGGGDKRSEQSHVAASADGALPSGSNKARAVRKWGPGGAQSVSDQVQHKAKSEFVPVPSSTRVVAEGRKESSAGFTAEKTGDALEESEDDSSGATAKAHADRKGLRTNGKTEHRMRPVEVTNPKPEAVGPMTVKTGIEMETPSQALADVEAAMEMPSDGASPRTNITVMQRNPDRDVQASTDSFGQLPPEEQSLASPSKVVSANSKSQEDLLKPDPSFASKLQKARDAASSLPRADPRKHGCVTLLGHAAAGKSELLASLMQATGDWDRRTAEKFLKEREAGAKSASETSSQRCATEGRRFTFFDPPGQKHCVAQAWSAVAQSDVAILAVSARAGEFEAGIAKGGQTREHAVLAKCAGMDNLIVVVNKMDGEARWSNLRYMEVRTEMGSALRSAGFYDEQVTYIPVCASSGANVGGDGDECEACAGWYSNGSLLENIESAASASRDSQAALRISVTGRSKGRGKEQIVGRVEQGTLDVGAHVVLVPPGPECGVQAIEVHDKEVRQAGAGEIVTLRLLGGVPSIGHALCCVEEPLRAAGKFKAQVRLVEMVDDPPVITAGFRCMLHLHGATEEVELSKLIEAVDPRTKKKELSPKVLRAPMVALCVIVLKPGREVPADSNGGRFARFCLRVDGGTIAIGKIAELPKVR